MKCSKCGAELSEDTKFCSYCGQKIEVTPSPVVEENEIPPIPDVEIVEEQKQGKAKADAPKSFADKAKDKGIEIWNKLSLYRINRCFCLALPCSSVGGKNCGCCHCYCSDHFGSSFRSHAQGRYQT